LSSWVNSNEILIQRAIPLLWESDVKPEMAIIGQSRFFSENPKGLSFRFLTLPTAFA
jgi:hypothetical protein